MFSKHSKTKHQNEAWNAKTIKSALDRGLLVGVTNLSGKTADVVYGYTPGGECVGMIIGKNGVIVTAYAAPESYWQSV